VHAYLDDWLILHADPLVARQQALIVWNFLEYLGWIVNGPKSCLEASQNFIFVGMNFVTSLDRVLVSPAPDVADRVQSCIQLLSGQPAVSARKTASVVSLLQYMADLVPAGRLRLRPLKWLVKDTWCQARGSWSDLLVMPQEVVQDLPWWASREAFAGVPAVPPQPSLTVCSDASKSGWGAICGDRKVQGLWSRRMAKLHINVLEMQAVLFAIKAFKDLISGKVVRWLIDNCTTVYYLKKVGGMKSRHLSQLAVQIHQLCLDWDIVIQAVYIPGDLNVAADTLSRQGQVIQSEWTLNHQVLEPVFSQWGRPWLDMFATRNNSRLCQFVSPYPDQEALAVDALSMDWNGLGLVYAFPPFKAVGEVIRKWNCSSGIQMILIAPWITAASWTPQLMQIAQQHWDLGHQEDLLHQEVQGLGRVLHPSPSSLRLHAWLL